RYALTANSTNRAVIDGWIEKWRPRADRAVAGLAAALPGPDAIRERAASSVAAFTARWAG
ncbi:toluene hydroxylase, partial [Mycobacterium palustre]|nr:toluene hydroxylase [Mycobacterium palustre]